MASDSGQKTLAQLRRLEHFYLLVAL